MKIPDKITLLGEDFEIIRVKKKELTCTACEEKCLGRIDPDTKEIFVAFDDEEEEEIEILLHELGHYYNRVFMGSDNEAGANSFGAFVYSIIKQLGYK